MSPDPSDQPWNAAIEQLETFGLSSYAARTYVALVSLGEGTAQDVSRVSTVPRTRVYDAAEELSERGLVDVRRTTPKRFWPISAETAGRQFMQDYNYRVNRLVEALDALEPRSATTEQRGVWTVDGRDTVTNRVVDIIGEATDEVVFMTVGELLTDDVLDRLRAASERGVSIKVAEMSNSVESDIRTTVPDAELFDSLWVWSDTSAGRLLMVDQDKTLVSVLAPSNADRSDEPRDETAIWGAGEQNSLVVVLKAIFTWQLKGSRG